MVTLSLSYSGSFFFTPLPCVVLTDLANFCPHAQVQTDFLQHPSSPSSVFSQSLYFYYNNHHITLYYSFLKICCIPVGSNLIKSRLSYLSLYPWFLAGAEPEKKVDWFIYVKRARQANPFRQEADLWVPGTWRREDKEWVLNSGWSEVTQSCPTLFDPMDCSLARLLCPWDLPGKNTGMDCLFLLQGIFLTQRSNPSLLHCRGIL